MSQQLWVQVSGLLVQLICNIKMWFALSDEPFFGPGGSEADKQQRHGFPYQMFYCEILEHKDLMSEDELINLIQWWNEYVYLICSVIT